MARSGAREIVRDGLTERVERMLGARGRHARPARSFERGVEVGQLLGHVDRRET